MLKLVGAALVMLSCSAMGFELSARLVRRKSNLEDIKNAIMAMLSEIRFSKKKAAEIFKEASGAREGIVFEIFKNVSDTISELSENASDAWEKEILKNEAELCFSKDETQVVCKLFCGFGESDIYNQQKILSHASEKIDILIKNASAQCDKSVKAYRSIGVMVGIFICVLFI